MRRPAGRAHIHRAPNNGATRPPAEIRLRQSKSQRARERDVHMNRNYNYVLYTEKETDSAARSHFISGPARSLNSLGLLLDLILCDFREIISRQQPTTSSISFAPTDLFFPFPQSNSDARCVESTFGFSRARSCRLQYSRELALLSAAIALKSPLSGLHRGQKLRPE